MIATKPFTYGTRRMSAGDRFEVSNRDSRLLLMAKKAKLHISRPKVNVPPPAEPPIEGPVPLDRPTEEAKSVGLALNPGFNPAPAKPPVVAPPRPPGRPLKAKAAPAPKSERAS